MCMKARLPLWRRGPRALSPPRRVGPRLSRGIAAPSGGPFAAKGTTRARRGRASSCRGPLGTSSRVLQQENSCIPGGGPVPGPGRGAGRVHENGSVSRMVTLARRNGDSRMPRPSCDATIVPNDLVRPAQSGHDREERCAPSPRRRAARQSSPPRRRGPRARRAGCSLSPPRCGAPTRRRRNRGS